MLLRKMIALLIVVILFIVGLLVWVGSFSSKITAEIAPADSTLTLNDKRHNQGTIKVRPGTYKVVVSRQDFETVSKTIKVVKGENKYIGINLISNSPTTASWYVDHPADAKLVEGISSKNFDLSSAEQVKKLPLIKNLPFIDQLYRIDYGRSRAFPNDSTAVAIYIKYYSEAGKQQASEWIKFKGFDPSKLEIIYNKASTG